MKMMGHDDFIIHQRRANFASERRDWRTLPVEGSAAYEGRKGPRNPFDLADFIGTAGLAIGIGLFFYMMGHVLWAALN